MIMKQHNDNMFLVDRKTVLKKILDTCSHNKGIFEKPSEDSGDFKRGT